MKKRKPVRRDVFAIHAANKNRSGAAGRHKDRSKYTRKLKHKGKRWVG